MLLKARGWTAVVLLSLALGIGANTALFTAVNGLLLKTLSVPHPDDLVRLRWAGENDMVRSSSDYGASSPVNGRRVRTTFSYATYLDIRKANRTLTDVAASAPIGGLNVIVDRGADIASALAVSGNFFRVLDVPPALGRLIGDEDDTPGAPVVAVISTSFWQKRFGGDRSAIGRVVTINNQPATIVGVLPPSFTGLQRLGGTAADVTVALAMDAVVNAGNGPPRLGQPTNWWLQLVGRLRPVTTLAQVQGNLEGVFQQSARNGMAAYRAGLTADERGLEANRRGTSRVPDLLVDSGRRGVYDLDAMARRSAGVLSGVFALVLLIVCANVANLLVSRATSRHDEIAIRMSIGATRRRLIRQMLTESLLLATLGGALGVLVGYWSRALLPFGAETPVDWRMFAFAAALSAITGVAFGLLPAFRATRVDLASDMKASSRSVAASRSWLSRGLLVLQVAVSLVLLVGAGLFLRTLQNLRGVDIGFNPDHLLMFVVNPQLNHYDEARRAEVFRSIEERLRAVPGVKAVALSRVPLLSGSTSTTSFYVPGRTQDQTIYLMSVTPEFFPTMEIPLAAGRGFTDRDTATSPKVALINETAARTFFPDGSPIGRRAGLSREQDTEYEIVGVVRDTKYNDLREAAPPTFYEMARQSPMRSLNVLVRTFGDPAALTPAVRAAVRDVDATLPITNIHTQTEQVEGRFEQERLFAHALSLFGGLALLLASIGLFGVMSYSVARRTNEIGIRMALGAQRPRIGLMVLGESMALVALGIGLGLLAAAGLGRYVASVLFGLGTTDPVTMSAAVAVIVVVSGLASYLPARRAANINPLIALQQR
jgi:predicted permease